MSRKSILLGLSAIGAIVLAGNASAQIVGGAGGAVGGTLGGVTGQAGAAGQVTAPIPDVPVDRATSAVRRTTDATTDAAKRAKAKATEAAGAATDTARGAASAGADASATTAGGASFPAGTIVRDSAGVQIGAVMDPDPSISSSGRVAIKTGSGFITVPASSLSMKGGVAVSSQSGAEISASGKAKTE